MARKIYVGESDVARSVCGAYVGVGGKARLIKKMYIGDESGKARLAYNYLDNVDHIEIDVDDCACYTSDDSGAGWNNVLVGKTRDVINANGGVTVNSNSIYVRANGDGHYALSNYIYTKVYAVLKGGNKIPINRASASINVSWSGSYGGSQWYYPFFWTSGDESGQSSFSGTETRTFSSGQQFAMCNRGVYFGYSYATYTINSVTFNGVTYSGNKVVIVDKLI